MDHKRECARDRQVCIYRTAIKKSRSNPSSFPYLDGQVQELADSFESSVPPWVSVDAAGCRGMAG